ncbi:MAG: type II toxin-antitoxin system RelE/ParE family toxin [Burkholderiaceae bacterium]|nr:type II toxin-antitoxin system RelE/ParE family toxin [Burkholderiaceae bacterium]
MSPEGLGHWCDGPGGATAIASLETTCYVYPTGYIITVRVLTTNVYLDWINGLKDVVVRARIQVRVDRLVHGNPGQHRRRAAGVSELKIDVGPGYRVYYLSRGDALVVLLAGGDKSSQQRDIELAMELARNVGNESEW